MAVHRLDQHSGQAPHHCRREEEERREKTMPHRTRLPTPIGASAILNRTRTPIARRLWLLVFDRSIRFVLVCRFPYLVRFPVARTTGKGRERKCDNEPATG
jgi:hypothetical protein